MRFPLRGGSSGARDPTKFLSCSLRLLTLEYQLESPCEFDGIWYRITDPRLKRRSALGPNYVLTFYMDLRAPCT